MDRLEAVRFRLKGVGVEGHVEELEAAVGARDRLGFEAGNVVAQL